MRNARLILSISSDEEILEVFPSATMFLEVDDDHLRHALVIQYIANAGHFFHPLSRFGRLDFENEQASTREYYEHLDFSPGSLSSDQQRAKNRARQEAVLGKNIVPNSWPIRDRVAGTPGNGDRFAAHELGIEPP